MGIFKNKGSKQNKADVTDGIYAFDWSRRGAQLFTPSKFANAKKSNYTKPKRRKK